MKSQITTMLVIIALFGGLFFFLRGNSGNGNNTAVKKEQPTEPAQNVTIVDGKQIVEIRARGGYQPRKSVAKAGLPTIVRFNTDGTFDCSSSVRIPSMKISKSLPQSGSTDIDLGSPLAGTLKGSCSMGMYPFEITFN